MGGEVIFKDNHAPIDIKTETKVRRSTVLGKLIEIIASGNEEGQDLTRDPAEIDKKIDHNQLTTYRWLVDSYIENSILVDSSMLQLNKDINSGTTKLKRQMNRFYRESLAKFQIATRPVDLEKLRTNADFVVEDIMKRATNFVHSSLDLGEGYYDEDISWGIELVTSYSIIECIVLENPNDNN
ncbi:TPA: hypothetical protein I7295_24705 [Vibrio parahaemolyticus]|nr:hypothetical protein [Vibrio parahaemolyticus]HAS6465771.1 hypothetical protein [Vibrio parahaemolyticus]HAS6911712.1 hypothetical protein [Vibrio parahaemolyticus]HAS6914054.1 hypothetical protein [Vibrio parahaemolyticus]HAS6922005.1 hypothetical protein [Vibrio parahaemolyticus]